MKRPWEEERNMSVQTAELQGKNGMPPVKFGEEVTGAETLLRSLILEQVEYIFGYPGGAVRGLPIS